MTRYCAVQVDLDTVGVLRSFFGSPGVGPEGPDETSLRALVEFRRLFEQEQVHSTLFVVGRDLERADYRSLVRSMFAQGHEIANHTHGHPSSLPALSHADRHEEIQACEQAIIQTTGEPPVGFRAPCYRIDRPTLDLLADAGYLYDASVLPSPFVILMKALHLATGLGRAGRNGPGSLAHALKSRNLYRECNGQRSIVEVPVSTAPWTRLPLHSTVLIHVPGPLSLLASRPEKERFVTMTFHLVDLMGPHVPASVRRRHPTAAISLEKRRRRCREIIRFLKREYTLVTTREMVDLWIDQGRIS